ncbi:MAG: metallophosphoesterase [Clostridia bacterium]|nr:metallophosphoesterase [Clostridia bacterium]
MAKKTKIPLTKAQKAARGRLALYIILLIVLVFALAIVALMVVNQKLTYALIDKAEQFKAVEYGEDRIYPVKDEDGDWCFMTDRTLKVLQITDVHIGAGFLSVNNDGWAMNAVATMITKEKPDLVIVTGDIGFPVPYAAGTLNNMNEAKVFVTLMNQLKVYWTFTFGNHDTEAYSFYTRENLSAFYEEEAKKSEYFLYQSGPKSVDGFGNQVIKVKNSAGITTQALVTMDSHSYTDGDVFGILWKYDNLQQNQIDWYAQKIKAINDQNAAIDPSVGKVKSLTFIHIPLTEYRTAYKEYVNNGGKDTENVDFIEGYGKNGEVEGALAQNPFVKDPEATYGVFCGMGQDEFFETASQIGLQGVFCGHDHMNNFSLYYKGVRLTYGMSIDYLAYGGIYKEKAQRGCTIIEVNPDGSFECTPSNYYENYKANDYITEHPEEAK